MIKSIVTTYYNDENRAPSTREFTDSNQAFALKWNVERRSEVHIVTIKTKYVR